MLKFLRLIYLTRTLWATLLALLVGSGLILIADINPLTAYQALFTGAFFDYYGFASTLTKMSPILLAGLAVIIPLRCGLLNIGAEGQIYLGGLFASMAALYLPAMPGWIHITVCMLAGMIGGGLWGFIPGYLKATRGINEVIVTLLMNYVGINLVSYFVGGPMMEEGAPYPYSEEIGEHLWLPLLMPGTDAHIGVLIGLLIAIFAWALMRYSTIGFSLSTVGTNPQAALYAGMSIKKHVMITMAVGGAVAGLAGTFEVIGLKYRLYHLFSPGYGFDGIVVAFLAGLNALFAPLAALFLSGLKAGAHIMQRAIGLEATVIEAIQGLVVIFVAASLALKWQGGNRVMKWLNTRRAVEAALEKANQGK